MPPKAWGGSVAAHFAAAAAYTESSHRSVPVRPAVFPTCTRKPAQATQPRPNLSYAHCSCGEAATSKGLPGPGASARK
eukprot:3918157-Pleurochrysis_carterae.AAC.2